MKTLLDTFPPVALDSRTSAVYDPDGQCRLVVATPSSSPAIWEQYIDGAYHSYLDRGVEDALEYSTVRSGAGTTAFCAVVDRNDKVIGGLRVQGPYFGADESHAICEWAGQQGLGALTKAIGARIPGGLIEVKAAFVDIDSPAAKPAAGLLARTPLILLSATGSRYMMATAADYVLNRWKSGGGRVQSEVEPTPYPDDRYQTRVMFWDRQTLSEHAQPAIWQLMKSEYYDLVAQQQGTDALVAGVA